MTATITLPEGHRIASDNEPGWTYHGLWITDAPAKETAAVPTTAQPAVTKRIGKYDKDTHDFPAYVIFEDGHEEYIGSRPTHHDASLLASDYIIQFYSDNHTPEAAARLIHEELAQEGRHEELARDMGGVWVTGECWEETGAPDEATLRQWAKEDAAIDIPTVLEVMGGDPEAVEIIEPEGRREQFAADQGLAWDSETGVAEITSRCMCGAPATVVVGGGRGEEHILCGRCFKRDFRRWTAWEVIEWPSTPTPINPPPCHSCGKPTTWRFRFSGGVRYYCDACTTSERGEFVWERIPPFEAMPDDDIGDGPDDGMADDVNAYMDALDGVGPWPKAKPLVKLPCPACQGAHPIQRCGAIGQLLMRPTVPFTDVCLSCGDQLNWKGPGLCNACVEAGERWPVSLLV